MYSEKSGVSKRETYMCSYIRLVEEPEGPGANRLRQGSSAVARDGARDFGKDLTICSPSATAATAINAVAGTINAVAGS